MSPRRRHPLLKTALTLLLSNVMVTASKRPSAFRSKTDMILKNRKQKYGHEPETLPPHLYNPLDGYPEITYDLTDLSDYSTEGESTVSSLVEEKSKSRLLNKEPEIPNPMLPTDSLNDPLALSLKFKGVSQKNRKLAEDAILKKFAKTYLQTQSLAQTQEKVSLKEGSLKERIEAKRRTAVKNANPAMNMQLFHYGATMFTLIDYPYACKCKSNGFCDREPSWPCMGKEGNAKKVP